MKRILLIILMLMPTSLFSQWHECNGPWGGVFYFLYSEGEELYAGTKSGLYQLNKTNNRWNLMTTYEPYFMVKTGDEMLIGTYDGVFYSKDTGKSWTSKNSGISNLSIQSMTMDSNCIYIGTPSGIYFTKNHGDKWTHIYNLLNGTVSSIYAKGEFLIAGIDEGIYLSTNSGANWSMKTNVLKWNNITSIIVEDNNIYAASNSGFMYSSDNGNTWIKRDTGQVNKGLRSIIKKDNIIIAASWLYGVMKSSDGGISWVENNNGILNKEANNIISLKNEIFVGTSNGCYHSSDNCQKWNHFDEGIAGIVPNGITVNDGYIFVGTQENGIFRSSDKGKSWEQKNNGLRGLEFGKIMNYGKKIIAIDNSNYYFYISDDYGENWKILIINQNDKIYGDFQIVDNSFYSTSYDSSCLIKSSDEAQNWNYFNKWNKQYYIESVLIDGNNFYVGTWYDGILVSTDYGLSWIVKNTPFSYLWSGELKKFGNNLLANTWDHGLFISSNKGDSWIAINSGFPINEIPNYCVFGNVIFAAPWNYSIYYSIDSGKNFLPFYQGIKDNLSFSSLYIDDNEETIYAGDAFGPVYYRSFSEFSTKVNEQVGFSNSFSLSPNPATDFLEISYSPSINRMVNHTVDGIAVYNVFGMNFPPHLTSSATPQEGNLRIDVSTLSPGVYFVKVGEKVGKFVKIEN